MTYRYHSEDPIKRRKLTLTKEQLHELKCYYVEDYIHDLTNNELKEIVFQNMINNMTDYSYSDTFYSAIVEEESHWFYPSFPQFYNNTCGKSIFNGEKR